MTLGVGKRATLLAFIRLCLAQAGLRDDKATKAAEAALMKVPAEALPEGITKATATTLCREVFRRVKGRVLVAHNCEWSKTIAGDRDAWLVRMKEGRRVRKVMVTERNELQCTCGRFTVEGVPCAHIAAMNGGVSFIDCDLVSWKATIAGQLDKHLWKQFEELPRVGPQHVASSSPPGVEVTEVVEKTGGEARNEASAAARATNCRPVASPTRGGGADHYRVQTAINDAAREIAEQLPEGMPQGDAEEVIKAMRDGAESALQQLRAKGELPQATVDARGHLVPPRRPSGIQR